MKIKKIVKKSISMLLTTVLMVSGLTIDARTVMTVNAEENTSVSTSVTTFATPDQLVSSDNFALHGDYTGVAQKVNFGKNGSSQQTWYIAGSDADNSIVLLCDPAKPMSTTAMFENDDTNNKTYVAGWGNYEPALGEGTEVYPNHYGASDLRVTLKTLETNTSVFTLSEQSMMQETMIYTNDIKNSSTYSTTDRLYAAYGDFDAPNDTYITVGANSADNLNDGLKVSLKTGPYAHGNSEQDSFWLREPYYDNSGGALLAFPGNYVLTRKCGINFALVPAFRMSLTSVLFASAAPAVSSDAGLTDTMTLRVDGKDKMASQAAYTTGGVTVNYEERGAKVFLYVQDADSVYSVEITGDTTVALSAMTEAGITSLTDGGTKIWLEKSEDNVTYAIMAEPASVTHVEAVSATCKSEGNIEYWYYTVGGTTYYFSDSECSNSVAESSLVILGVHDYQFDSFKWADDGSDCKAVFVCDNDESHIVERDCVITKKIKTAPTCVEKGITTYTATYADSEGTKTDTKDVTDISVVEHTWDEGKITKQPTVGAEGEKNYICSVCGETKTEKIAALGLPEGTEVTSEDGTSIYQVTESKENGGTVTYLTPTNKRVNSITIPATVVINGVTYKVTKIADNAFSGCRKLKNVTIGENVTTIGDKAFYKCTSLVKITIPSKVKKIGKSAFQNCKKLKNITIKTKKLTAKRVGKNAFKGVGSKYYKKVVVKVPGKKYVGKYKKMLQRRGLSKKAKVKK